MAALGICALPLLSACGDDLEDRQAAVEERQPANGAMTMEQSQIKTESGSSPSQGASTAQDSESETTRMDDEVVVDAEPEVFVDDAQGFSTDPVDDTAGFDPTPRENGGFAPEPIAPEIFED
ncbi:hypothetical protein D2V07_10930 [Aurantiacibacter zhengii]|uniref:DUF3035 domain-containing protein n=2 Tax=Aurantiacibacter zhengii TaxID=2307003 RepID=A0A418NS10_9SPHN|nr:hypothetical protein D2V07_10930 [Aurantiacibacter zhengii]